MNEPLSARFPGIGSRVKSLLAVLLLLFLWSEITSAQERTFSVRAFKDVAYVQDGHVRQRLDIHVPEKPSGPLPLIVWIHGGAWNHGNKGRCLPLPWTAKGYVVASIDYRLSDDSRFPAQIEDCKAAIWYLRSHAGSYKIDPTRIVAWGASAGGHLASLLGTAGDVSEWEQGDPAGSSRVQAVIDWYGRVDLTPVCRDPSWAGSPSAGLLGGSGTAVSELARQASPILHVSRDDPPFLIMHGDRDDVVPLSQSRDFETRLKQAGVAVQLVVLKGAGHGGEEFLQDSQIKIIDHFLENTSLRLGGSSERR